MNSPPAVQPLRLRRIPLLLVAFCFAAGELMARNYQPTRLFVLSVCLLLALAIYSLKRAPSVVLIPVCALWAVVGCWCAQIQPPVPQQTALRSYADGLSRNVQGSILRVSELPQVPTETDPQQPAPWQIEPGGWESEAGATRQSIDLQVTAIEYLTPDISTMVPIDGGVRIVVVGNPLPLHCGDQLALPLRLRTPDIYRDPGAGSYAAQLLSEGIGVTANVKSQKITQLPTTHAGMSCTVSAVQTWASGRLDNFLTSPANRLLPPALRLNAEDTAMLNAMLFGNRDMLTHSLRDAFQRTGTFHLVVVSGLHVALLAGGIFWMLRRLRMPEGAAVVLTIALATAYTVLVGFGVPAQRALLMASIYLVARWLDREVTALNALGFAALTVLILDPRALLGASFQMTFLIVVAIAGIAAPLIQRLVGPYTSALQSLHIRQLDAFQHPKIAQFRLRVRMACDLSGAILGSALRNLPSWMLRTALYLLDAIILSLIAEFCMVIPMAVYFHRATLFALPLNLLNLPLLAALLCSSIVMFCASLLSPWLAILPAAITAALLHLMRVTIIGVKHISLADIRLPQPTAPALLLSAIAIIASVLLLRTSRRFTFGLGALCTVLIPVAALYPVSPRLHPGILEITALDVGQGDSLLVVSPQGQTMLVDAGGPVGRATNLPAPAWDVGEQVVAPYLWSRQIRSLDIIVLTHAHSDHMGGMSAILHDFRPHELWLSVEPGDSPGLRSLLAEAAALNVHVRHLHAGDAVSWGGVNATVLSPEPGYTNAASAINDDSLVMRLDFGAASALLEGDAEVRSEDTMLSNHRLSPVTLLKVGHHGSKTSTNPEFLQAVTPREAVISVGRHNTFGHPRSEVLERLEAAQVRTFRTDRNGAETFLLTQTGEIAAFSAGSND
jgi:competence protein ComEC